MIPTATGRVIVTPAGHPAWAEAVRNNWYEASRWSPHRSWVWYPVQDAKHDLDRFTRYELSKHARYLVKNSPFVRGLCRRLTTLTVGSGFRPAFRSPSNPEWAVRAQEVWRRKSRNVHLGYKCSFSQYQRAIALARFVDGEAFSIKTFDEVAMENRVQSLESDRCVGRANGQDHTNIFSVDGINLNKQASPVSYQFRNVDAPYPAQDVIHHYTPDRPQQYRGETILAAAINTARDVDDILSLEKQAVKDASSKQDIIETPTGELNPETFRSLRFGDQYPTLFNLPTDDRTKDDYYRVKFSGQPVVLRAGDKYTPYKPDRPGGAWQGFMDFLANTICLSTNLPPSVLLPIPVGGTDIRRDLDIAQRVVEPWQLDIAMECEEIVLYLMEEPIYDGELTPAPKDWYLAWHFPPKINVDRAQAQQDREDVKAGLMSWEEYHGRYGDDGDAEERTIIEEVKRRRDRIQSAGFKDPQEFIQYLTLDAKAQQAKQIEDKKSVEQ